MHADLHNLTQRVPPRDERERSRLIATTLVGNVGAFAMRGVFDCRTRNCRVPGQSVRTYPMNLGKALRRDIRCDCILEQIPRMTDRMVQMYEEIGRPPAVANINFGQANERISWLAADATGEGAELHAMPVNQSELATIAVDAFIERRHGR